MRFSSTLLFVTDLRRSSDFYQRLLQLPAVFHGPDLAQFDIGHFALMLHADRKPDGKPRGAGVNFHFAVDDVDQTWQRLDESGFALECKPVQQPWGMREFSMKDPDGYEIEILEESTAG